jgi:hypothetical protein
VGAQVSGYFWDPLAAPVIVYSSEMTGAVCCTVNRAILVGSSGGSTQNHPLLADERYVARSSSAVTANGDSGMVPPSGRRHAFRPLTHRPLRGCRLAVLAGAAFTAFAAGAAAPAALIVGPGPPVMLVPVGHWNR